MYKEMYYRLFNTLTDAMELIRQGRSPEAYQLLKEAQQAGEERYLEGKEA